MQRLTADEGTALPCIGCSDYESDEMLQHSSQCHVSKACTHQQHVKHLCAMPHSSCIGYMCQLSSSASSDACSDSPSGFACIVPEANISLSSAWAAASLLLTDHICHSTVALCCVRWVSTCLMTACAMKSLSAGALCAGDCA